MFDAEMFINLRSKCHFLAQVEKSKTKLTYKSALNITLNYNLNQYPELQ